MTFRSLFFTDAGRLRAVWRILLFLAVTLVCWNLASVFLGPVFTAFFGFLGLSPLSNQTYVGATALIAATVISVKVIDPRPWSDLWLGAESARPRTLVEGFLIGALAIGVPTAVLVGANWLSAVPGEQGPSWGGAAVRVSLFLLPAALSEELGTRGYVFAVLRESWGWKVTLVATSVAFGLLHITNPGASAASVALVVIAGVFLGAVLIATRSLYSAWMAHFAWNWTMAVLFHTAVSGWPMEAPAYRYVDAGPDWATGGVWGPEGGVPAALGMGAGTGAAYLLARRRQRANREETRRG